MGVKGRARRNPRGRDLAYRGYLIRGTLVGQSPLQRVQLWVEKDGHLIFSPTSIADAKRGIDELTPTKNPKGFERVYRVALRADARLSAALTKRYGGRAGDMRYHPGQWGPSSTLHALARAKHQADDALREWFAQSRGEKNPGVLHVIGNPPRRGQVMSERVVEVRYRHRDDRKYYRHPFRAGVQMIAQPDGSLLIRSAKGQRLWGEF